MRVFIAIEFEDKVKRYLKEVQDIVKTTTYNGNFTNFNNFHLTVKYIGEIYNGEYHELIECINDICSKVSPFSIKIGDIGYFHKKSANIVWVGVTKGKEQLIKLQKNYQ
jgi:2'-5' RNA ligase